MSNSYSSPWGAGGSAWSSVGDIGASVGNMFGAAAQQSFDQASANDQNKFNLATWKFNKKENKKQWEHEKKGVAIQRENEANERGWRDTTALNDWNHGMAIRDFEFKNQMRAYNKSEETYAQQLNFNNMAAQVAMESEDRWLDERFKETAFQNQDIMVQLLQEEGQAGLLQPGKSAGKAVHSLMAQAGRNQAVLAESLTSAKKQHSVNLKKIKTDKFGADLQADANRMLRPEISPALPKPIPLPQVKLQDPRRPGVPPKPPKVRARSQSGNMIGAGLSAVIGVASLFSDERLKEGIVLVGQSDSGLNIYEFNYIGEQQRYRGVLAQELINVKPEAVVIDESGFYRVNYDIIDVNMQPV